MSNEFEFDVPESFDNPSNFIDKAGWYHFVVTGAVSSPLTAQGNVLEGLKISASSVGGTEASCVGKQTEMVLFHPKLSDKDEGKFARLRQALFFEAIKMLDRSNKGKSLTIDLDQALGRQFVAKIAMKDGYARLDGANVFHVDAEKVEQVPKSEKHINEIPQALRLTAEEKANIPDPPQQQSQPEQQQPVAAAASETFSADEI